MIPPLPEFEESVTAIPTPPSPSESGLLLVTVISFNATPLLSSANIPIPLFPATLIAPSFIISTAFPVAPTSFPYACGDEPVAIPTIPYPESVIFIVPEEVFSSLLPFVPYIPTPLSRFIVPLFVIVP